MKIYVPLTMGETNRLLELAIRERRRPQDQAAVLIAQALDASDGPEESPAHLPPQRGEPDDEKAA